MKANFSILLVALGTAFCWHVAAQTNELRAIEGKNYDVNNSPEWKTITIPAGSGLENTRVDGARNYRALDFPPIHFDGTIKPIKVSFILPKVNNHTRNISVSIANFPYTPDWFKEGQLPVTQLMIYQDVFRGLVTKSNLVLRVFPLHPSYSITNYDALGHATISVIPAEPVFDYGLPPLVITNTDYRKLFIKYDDQPKLVIKSDATKMALVAGIYQFKSPESGITKKMDLRSDGTAQTWFQYGYDDAVLGWDNVKWSAAADGVVLVGNSTFKIERDDLIDASGNRWLRTR